MQMANVNIKNMRKLPSLRELSHELPTTVKMEELILDARTAVEIILSAKGGQGKLLVIVGPCSVHNVAETLEYAERLSRLSKVVASRVTIIMRVCGDKPRTRKDWEGFMKDPHLDGSCDMVSGFRLTRKLMLRILELGVPIATEALHRTAFNVVSDLVSYAWIGARTIADPEKRALASGLSMPVGMKNPDHGPLSIAVNAIDYARQAGTFDGPDEDNVVSIIETAGNQFAHLILRGTAKGTNHDPQSIKEATSALSKAGLIDRVVVDCSHGNTSGNYLNQITVAQSLMDQVVSGEGGIAGLMLESYLKGGKQDSSRLGTPEGAKSIKPSLSVTDACLSWEDTEALILHIYKKLGGV
jgi:3-deoxy-7-phosphoheptulonate synthase